MSIMKKTDSKKTRDAKGHELEAVSSVFSRRMLLTVSFFEGAAVMVIELLGSKIIAPFYGTSLYVWASVLGVTLMALAFGYYAGGWISQKFKGDFYLYLVIAVGAIFTLLAPKMAPSLMMATAGFGVRLGSFLSVLLFLFPPVACMGMVSPIIIQLINENRDNAGLSAGIVYAISTVGGILATFLAGFYLIPELGIHLTGLFTGGILMLIAVIGFFTRNRKTTAIVAAIVFILMLPFDAAKAMKGDGTTTIRYQSSGILGEWTVVDQVVAIDQGQPLSTRQLLLNGVDQTYTEVGNEPVSMWFYPHKLAALAGIKPQGSKALLLGMGGGSIAHNLIQLGFDLDIVELDNRVPGIAEKWFGYDPSSANLLIDDARHFIKNTPKKYDLVVLDIVNGEVQPSHVFTEEGLGELRKILEKDALVIVNFQGRFDMEVPALSVGPRSVFKTFESVGFSMFAGKRSAEDQKNVSADLLIYGTPGKLDFDAAFQKGFRYNDIFTVEKFTLEDFKAVTGFSLADAQIMTDDKPNLELLNAPTILDWRKNKIEYTVNGLLNKGLLIYN
jgi:predicted membrane-bound spermidine synthase